MNTTTNTPTTPAEHLASIADRFEKLRKALHAFEGLGVSALAWHNIPNNEFMTLAYRGLMETADMIAADLADLTKPAE